LNFEVLCKRDVRSRDETKTLERRERDETETLEKTPRDRDVQDRDYNLGTKHALAEAFFLGI